MSDINDRKVTRVDVAREAGTSVAVVSYVINNGPRPVAEATKQKVLAAIQKTGYRPNGIAKALASGSTQTYGLVIPDISNPFLASIAHALQREAFKHGHVLLLGDAGDSRLREKELINNLLLRQVEGLIYTSVDRHPYIDLIQSSGTPCVMLDRVESGEGLSTIQVNEKLAAYKITHHLIQHGYKNIGIICGPKEMLNTQDRLAGWLNALEGSSLIANPKWILNGEYTRDWGYQAIHKMSKDGLPDAIFATNELQAFGCLKALAELNLRVPEDIALVCFNGTIQSEYTVPSLTTVRQPVDKIAEKAIQILQNWSQKKALYEVEFELQIGHSCGCKTR
ncbi:Catabolite control protein [Providencia heimbachae]|nr:LacI family DNA-binding transcriptional regulator [Providencia heimbachae]SQH11560.1 Catabolite control protein [Providencia heimbachae]